MAGARWPDVPVPDPGGPTAKRHLEWILDTARKVAAPNAADIARAIAACLGGQCLQPGAAPQRGKSPRGGAHGTSVLAARVHAAEFRWKECLDALCHGEQSDAGKKKG